MRVRTLAAVLAATGAVGLAGCGSDASTGDQVPKSTPDLAVPAGADVLASGSGGADTTSTTSTTSSTSTIDTTGTTTAPGAAAGGTTTAAPAAPAAPTQT